MNTPARPWTTELRFGCKKRNANAQPKTARNETTEPWWARVPTTAVPPAQKQRWPFLGSAPDSSPNLAGMDGNQQKADTARRLAPIKQRYNQPTGRLDGQTNRPTESGVLLANTAGSEANGSRVPRTVHHLFSERQTVFHALG